ncbi:MAG: phage integrase SAM-like domain-containing protein, partial [Tannerella sp.]|nr:phage integrase SAM-like domain-containing protein [Tannerella sp.]
MNTTPCLYNSYCSAGINPAGLEQSTLSGFADVLIRELQDNDRKSTANAYQSSSNRLAAFMGNADLPLEHITPLLMRDYETHLLEDGL